MKSEGVDCILDRKGRAVFVVGDIGAEPPEESDWACRSLLDMFKVTLWLLLGKRLQWDANAEAVRPVEATTVSRAVSSVELSAMVGMSYTCCCDRPSHMRLQILRNVSRATKELNFKFYLILITLALNSHLGLAVTTGDSAGPDGNDLGPVGSSEGGKTWPEPMSISRVRLTDFSTYGWWAGRVINGPGLRVVKSGFEFWHFH